MNTYWSNEARSAGEVLCSRCVVLRVTRHYGAMYRRPVPDVYGMSWLIAPKICPSLSRWCGNAGKPTILLAHVALRRVARGQLEACNAAAESAFGQGSCLLHLNDRRTGDRKPSIRAGFGDMISVRKFKKLIVAV